MAGAAFSASGSVQLAALAKQLKAASRGDLRRELLRGLRQATAPARSTVPESARATLPRRGGLGELIATEVKVTTRSSLSGSQARVRIVATENHSIGAIDAGRVRHPTFGKPNSWVTQNVRPGFFSTPMRALQPAAYQQVQAAIVRIQRSLIT